VRRRARGTAAHRARGGLPRCSRAMEPDCPAAA